MSTDRTYQEQELFRRIAAGDSGAFSTIFHAYFPLLYRNAFKLLKSEFWAEEVVQVVFSQLWANRSNLPAVDMPAAYLYRMVTNKARDRMRQYERELKIQYYLSQQVEGTADDKSALHEREALHALLEKAIAALPPQRREVYKLKYQKDLSYEQIAAQLALSKNTVRNHLAKALEDLRHFLLEHAGLIGWLTCCSLFFEKS